MKDYDGFVGIYSKDNFLTQKLKNKLNEKYYDTLTLTSFKEEELLKLDYLLIDLLDKKDSISDLPKIIKELKYKVIILYPLYVHPTKKFIIDTEISSLIKANPNIGVLLVPELLGDGVAFQPDNVTHNLIMQSLLSERIKIDKHNDLINIISTTSLIDRIIKDIFSFGISGQQVALMGERIDSASFASEYLKIDPENIMKSSTGKEIAMLYFVSSAKVLTFLKAATNETRKQFESLTDSKIENSLIPVDVKKDSQKIIKRKKLFFLNYKILSKLTALVLLLWSVPTILIILSLSIIFLSTKTVLSNNNLSTNILKTSQKLLTVAESFSFGNNLIYDTSSLINKSVEIGLETIVLSNHGKDLTDKIMADNIYDMTVYSNNISASLDKIHTNISFLQSDINELGGFPGRYLRKIISNRRIDLDNYKNKIYSSKNLFSRLSLLLGEDKPKKYLVLFQNNMELRPTGGFIGSFALLTFNRGRLSEIVINDVYDADGQLKGHVDPPEPIRIHLGEGGWYLRDSNWDPDFSISAKKAEWFLDKEIGVQVDGVIAVDLFFVKDLLNIVGPIKLADFDNTINANNLYQVIQSEVEDEFFPGSIKKSRILTSLSKSLISSVENLSSDVYLGFFKSVYENLERKHLQLYFHDPKAQEALRSLGYAGEVKKDVNCGTRCLEDGYLLIDSNLGVNKANYFIKRSHELNTSIAKEFVGHELFVTYENEANPAIGNSGVYKNYARLILPTNSVIGGVRLYETTGVYNEVEFERVENNGKIEIGFLIEVLPGSLKKLQIVWNNIDDKLKQGGEYRLYVSKQAGTDGDPLTINIRPQGLVLTDDKLSVYNTSLVTDFKTRLFFKPTK